MIDDDDCYGGTTTPEVLRQKRRGQSVAPADSSLPSPPLPSDQMVPSVCDTSGGCTSLRNHNPHLPHCFTPGVPGKSHCKTTQEDSSATQPETRQSLLKPQWPSKGPARPSESAQDSSQRTLLGPQRTAGRGPGSVRRTG